MKKIFSLILSLIFVLLNPIKVNAVGKGNPLGRYPDLVDEFIKLENNLLNKGCYGEQMIAYHRAPSTSPFEFDEYRDIYLVNIPYLLQDNCGFVRAYINAIEATLQSLPMLQKAKKELGKEAENNVNKLLNKVYEYTKDDPKFDGLTDYFNQVNSPNNDKEEVRKSIIKGMFMHICSSSSLLALKGISGILLILGSIISVIAGFISSGVALDIGLIGAVAWKDSIVSIKEKLSTERAINYACLLNKFACELVNDKRAVENSNYMIMAVDARRFTSWNPLNANRENQGSWLGFGYNKCLNSSTSPMAKYCITKGGINQLIKKIEDTLNGKTVDLELIKQKVKYVEANYELLPKKTSCLIQ